MNDVPAIPFVDFLWIMLPPDEAKSNSSDLKSWSYRALNSSKACISNQVCFIICSHPVAQPFLIFIQFPLTKNPNAITKDF